MQLQLTLAEAKLLVDLLENREEIVEAEIVGTHDECRRGLLQREEDVLEALLQGIAGSQFDFAADELETLASVLATAAEQLQRAIADAPAVEASPRLQRRRQLLAAVRDKVTEACAMA